MQEDDSYSVSYNSFSKVLNLDTTFYDGIDEAILLFFETYVSTIDEYVRLVHHIPKNEIDIYSKKDQNLLGFIKYGLNLMDGGLLPDVLEILLKNAHEVIINNCEDINKKDILRLELLYVAQSIKLFHSGDLDAYLSFTNQLSSNRIEMGKIYSHFNNVNRLS